VKTYLFPLLLRRGSPVMTFIEDDKGYWLGIYHRFVGRGAPARTSDYHAVSRTSITKDLYDAFRREAAKNRARYRVQRKVTTLEGKLFRKERR
jgi:hypothetical protein